MGLPLRGSREGTILGLRPYWLHGMPHYHVYFKLDTDDEEDDPHELPLDAEQLPEDPRPGDRVKMTFTMRQIEKVERIGRVEDLEEEEGEEGHGTV